MYQMTSKYLKWIVGMIGLLLMTIVMFTTSPKTTIASSSTPPTPQPLMHNQIGENQTGLEFKRVWVSGKGDTKSVIWGDVNNDGYLDLVHGGYNWIKLYINNEGKLSQTPQIISTSGIVGELALGDMNSDGFLDLAVGGGFYHNGGAARNEVYRNKKGTFEPIWVGEEDDVTTSVAWGDINGDGYLDLAVGNYKQPNKVYVYDKKLQNLQATPVWTDSVQDLTQSVIWGDVNEDGYLDLIVGNKSGKGCDNSVAVSSGPNKIYLNNQHGSLETQPAWIAETHDCTVKLAWSDMNGDGLKDLVVSNIFSYKVYLNSKKPRCFKTKPWLGIRSE